jgi:hypothetical protein
VAILRHLGTGDALALAARVVVGRAHTAGLVVPEPRVSGEHAVLSWTGQRWEVRDLGSRNGTFVDGRRLGPGDAAPLAVGARLAFGGEAPAFVLEHAGAPGAMAVATDGATVHARDGLLALPSADRPEVLVFSEPSGGWVLEAGDDRRAVGDGERIPVAGATWTLHIPRIVEGTATVDAGPTLDTVTLRFQVSRDEEHVRMELVHRGRAIPTEPREHGYVLLTLARRRLADAAEPLAEQGWVDRDQLLRMLQLDANGLNVAIYRARGQLAAAGLLDSAGIVEVRRGQRRIGIDPSRLHVGPLEG